MYVTRPDRTDDGLTKAIWHRPITKQVSLEIHVSLFTYWAFLHLANGYPQHQMLDNYFDN